MCLHPSLQFGLFDTLAANKVLMIKSHPAQHKARIEKNMAVFFRCNVNELRQMFKESVLLLSKDVDLPPPFFLIL